MSTTVTAAVALNPACVCNDVGCAPAQARLEALRAAELITEGELEALEDIMGDFVVARSVVLAHAAAAAVETGERNGRFFCGDPDLDALGGAG